MGHTAHLSSGQCPEDNEETQYVGTVSSRHCPQRRQKNPRQVPREHCVQRKQCQLLARHLDDRIYQSNASKGVVIRATDFMRADSVDGCNERSTMHSWHPEKNARMPPPSLASNIHGQQVLVLGQPLNGILSRCIP